MNGSVTTAYQGLANVEGILAGVRLGNEQVLDVDPQLLAVGGVEGVLGVDEGTHPAQTLGFGDDVRGEGGLTGRFGPVDLDDAAPGYPSDAERGVEGEGARGDGGNPGRGGIAQAHDRPFAELLIDLFHRQIERTELGGILFCHDFLFGLSMVRARLVGYAGRHAGWPCWLAMLVGHARRMSSM
jgi:hypothetical protein